MAQERRVLLANGQYITIVQTTGTSSGDVMSQSAVTAALNTKANVSHTHAASDITSGAFGTDRIADGAITKAKLGSDVQISTTSYEYVVVTVAREDGTAMTGVTVNIADVPYVTDSDGKTIGKVVFGTSYTVECTDAISWYAKPSPRVFTAQMPQREVSMVYETAKMGVFIEATDNTLYRNDDWDPNKTANSIVVAGDGVSFRIALTQPSSQIQIHNMYNGTLDNYITAISGETKAKADYDGAGNTANIMKLQPSTGYAAGYCNSFTFPDGKTKGFLPALGQLNLAYQNKAAVDAALTACGGTAISNWYWSSTFWGVNIYTNRFCWNLRWGDGSISHGSDLSSYSYVRPFASYSI